MRKTPKRMAQIFKMPLAALYSHSAIGTNGAFAESATVTHSMVGAGLAQISLLNAAIIQEAITLGGLAVAGSPQIADPLNTNIAVEKAQASKERERGPS